MISNLFYFCWVFELAFCTCDLCLLCLVALCTVGPVWVLRVGLCLHVSLITCVKISFVLLFGLSGLVAGGFDCGCL